MSSLPSQDLDIHAILKMLPHRYPFLLVDRVVMVDLEHDRLVAHKNVSFNEPFFQGHFPGQPIMPGVLILEALAQAGGILMYLKGYTKIKLLTGVQEAKFRRPVMPGDLLKLEVTGRFMSQRGGRLTCCAWVDEQKAVEAEISFSSFTL